MAFLEYKPTQTLYQFCSVDSFKKILTSKVVWCTDLESANDPRELKLGYKHFLDALKFVRENEYKGQVGNFLADLAQRVMTGHARQQAFCACFSVLADDLPMWREYGDDCRGVAIGFKPTAITSLPGRIQKVKYLDADTPEQFRQLVRDLARNFDPYRSPDDVSYWAAATSGMLAAATTLKHHSWEYEKEIRFVYAQVSTDPGRSLPVSKFDDETPIYWQKPLSRSRGSGKVDYLAFQFGLRRAKTYKCSKAIERLVIGPNCTLSVADVHANLQRNGFEDVDIVKSECEIR